MAAERIPKEIPIAKFSRTKHLAQVVVRAKDVTGAMADINARLSSEGADVRQSVAFAVDREGYFVYNAFVWFKKKGYSLDRLVEELRRSPYVLGVQVKDGVEGAVIDTVAFPVQSAEARVVLLAAEALVGMFDALDRVFGSGGKVILKEQGFDYGRAWTEDLAKTLTTPYIARNIRYWLEMLRATGWGVPRMLEANRDLTRVLVRIDDSFECKGRSVKGPSASFLSGVLTGVFSFLSGKKLRGTETVCISDGADHCEILISEGQSP